MKKYRVNVNGTVYEVELEEITGAAPAAAAPVARRRREGLRSHARHHPVRQRVQRQRRQEG